MYKKKIIKKIKNKKEEEEEEEEEEERLRMYKQIDLKWRHQNDEN